VDEGHARQNMIHEDGVFAYIEFRVLNNAPGGFTDISVVQIGAIADYDLNVYDVDTVAGGIEVDGPTVPLPSTPILYTANPGDGNVTLNWSTSSYADGYELKYGTRSGNYTRTIDAGNTTTYTVSGLSNDTTYYFVVSAYNNVGSSDNSNELSATPEGDDPIGGIIELDLRQDTTTVTNTLNPVFTLRNIGDSSISLSDLEIRYYYTIDTNQGQSFWCDHAAIVSPQYSGITDSVQGSFVQMQDSTSDADYYLSVEFSGGALEAGAIAEIQTRFSKNDWSNYDQSNDFSFNNAENVAVFLNGQLVWGNTPGEAIIEPEPPTEPRLNSAVAGDEEVTLNWSSVSNADGYEVKYGTRSGSYSRTIDVRNTTRYTVSGLTNNTTYYFVVSAYNDGGSSNNSNEMNATPESGTQPTGDLTIEIGLESAEPGDRVTVPVMFSDVAAAGINSADFRVGYDSSVVEAVSVSAGGIVPRPSVDFRSHINTDREFVAFLFVDEGHARQNMIHEDGVFAYIEFRVLNNAPGGFTDISVVQIGAIADYDLNVYDVDTVAGGIEVGDGPPPSGDLTIEVGVESAEPGDRVTVPVMFSDVAAAGINSADFRVGYDSSVVEAVSVSAGGIVPRPSVDFRSHINTDREFVAFLFVDEGHARQNMIHEDGVFAYIHFKVLDNAPRGFTDISVVQIGAIADYDLNVYDVDTVAGGIEVGDGPPPSGDLTIEVGVESAEPGDRVTVPVMFSDVAAAGINSADFRVGYDSSVVEAVSVSAGGIVPRPSVDFRSHINTDREFVAFLFVDEGHARQNMIHEDGVFAYIDFKVLDNAPEGLTEISVVQIGAIADYDLNVYDVGTEAGGINVTEEELIPGIPELTSAVVGDEEVTLNWSSSSNADGYVVKYGTTSGNYSQTIDVGNTTAYTVSDLTNDTTYYFVVSAYNVSASSEDSNELSATPNVITLEIGIESADPGETVTVPVTFSDVPEAGIQYTEVRVLYDGSVLEAISVSAGEIIPRQSLFQSHIDTDREFVNFLYADEDHGQNMIHDDGVFAYIKFRVLDNAQEGLTELATLEYDLPNNYRYVDGGIEVGKIAQELTLEIGKDIEHRGEEVTLPVKFRDVPSQGISSADFKIDFDISAFEVVEVSPGEIISDTSDFTSIVNNEEGTIDFVFSSEDQIQSDGEFANITFVIQERCRFGAYEISASDIDAITSLGREVEVEIIAGEIYVEPRGLIGPPPVPELISVEAGDGEVTVKWEPVRHAENYLIYIGTNPVLPIAIESAGSGDVSEYTVTGLTNDTTYYFAVASASIEGNSDYSNHLTATPTASEGLSAPELLTAEPGEGSVTLNWSRVDNANGYIVHYQSQPGEEPVTIDVASTTAYTVSDLVKLTYYFTITAYNDEGTSGHSNVVHATPLEKQVSEFTIDIAMDNVSPGEKVMVPVILHNVPEEGINSADFRVGYDSSVVEAVSVSAGEIVPRPLVDFRSHINTDREFVAFLFVDEGHARQNMIHNDGVFAYIEFRVLDNAPQGLTEISVVQIGAIADYDLNVYDVDTLSGGINIE
ncbi:cohesin domain-containing protein, partial [Natronospora cellulosivora (SeqCode)]